MQSQQHQPQPPLLFARTDEVLIIGLHAHCNIVLDFWNGKTWSKRASHSGFSFLKRFLNTWLVKCERRGWCSSDFLCMMLEQRLTYQRLFFGMLHAALHVELPGELELAFCAKRDVIQ